MQEQSTETQKMHAKKNYDEDVPDYDLAGQQLLLKSKNEDKEQRDEKHIQTWRATSTHNICDVIFQHAETGAKLYIGSMSAAHNESFLRERKILRIVNCQGKSSENFHEGKPGFIYFRFDISAFHHIDNVADGSPESPSIAFAFFRKVFAWIDSELASGHNVLVHCLAGAHRAGTTGVAYLMWARATSVLAFLSPSSASTTRSSIFLEGVNQKQNIANADQQDDKNGKLPKNIENDTDQIDNVIPNNYKNVKDIINFERTLRDVKRCRPIVDPFGRLEDLLRSLEAGLLAEFGEECEDESQQANDSFT